MAELTLDVARKILDAALAKARGLAAHLLQASEGELVYADGRFAVQGSARDQGRAIALPALARSAEDPANLPDGGTYLGVGPVDSTPRMYVRRTSSSPPSPAVTSPASTA